MKKVHLLPNVITTIGLTCGLFVIFKMTMTPLGEASYQVLTATAGILLIAVFADLIDGAIARAMKAESTFGGLFDSLADAITFGVAPSVIVLKALSIAPGEWLSVMLTLAAICFSVCGVLRLVRYNVMAPFMKGEEVIAGDKKNFTGLPIPAAAAAIVSVNLFFISDEFRALFAISNNARAWWLFFALIILGYFMISRWKFPSFRTFNIRVASFQLVFLTVLGAVILFYGILHHFSVVFFVISWGYIVIAWTLSIIRLIAGKKSKTLEDFEPDPEDWE